MCGCVLVQFVNELVRVAAPDGTIIIVTWCHRDLAAGEESLEEWEQNLLNKICDAFYLPAWCSTAHYVQLLESLSLQVSHFVALKMVYFHQFDTNQFDMNDANIYGRTSNLQIGLQMSLLSGLLSFARPSHGRASPRSCAVVINSLDNMFMFILWIIFVSSNSKQVWFALVNAVLVAAA